MSIRQILQKPSAAMSLELRKHEADAICRRYASFQNVLGIVVIDSEGRPFRSTFSEKEALSYAEIGHQIACRAFNGFQKVNKTDECVEMVKIMMRSNEAIIWKERFFTLMAIQELEIPSEPLPTNGKAPFFSKSTKTSGVDKEYNSNYHKEHNQHSVCHEYGDSNCSENPDANWSEKCDRRPTSHNEDQNPSCSGDLNIINQSFHEAIEAFVPGLEFSNLNDMGNKKDKDSVKNGLEKEELTLEGLIGIRQFYIDIDYEDWKFDTLLDLFNALPIRSHVIIFCNSRDMVEQLTQRMLDKNFSLTDMSLDKDLENSQNIKFLTFRPLTNGTKVLITTDPLPLCIDVNQSGLVINYDLPSNMEHYVHRIGPLGRNRAAIINFVTTVDKQNFKHMKKCLNTRIDEMIVHEVAYLIPEDNSLMSTANIVTSVDKPMSPPGQKK